MKEVKLRKYDRGLKALVYSERLEGESEVRFEFSPFDSSTSWLADSGNKPELMLYTGVNDAEGRRIYEGDIVRIEHDNEPAINQPVHFSHGKFIPVCDYYPEEMKVVGNVFKARQREEI